MPSPLFHRNIILFVLGYEALGCLLGGTLLLLGPDGHLLKMPVTMLHGIFKDFLLPAMFLFGLGLLNAFAFFSQLYVSQRAWLLSTVVLGGMVIWFVVEIAVLQDLHWLHAMWGLPVLFGLVALMRQRQW
jgi:hypothetical protein